MIQKTLTSFDLKQIADSGQCFRMLPAEEANTYTVISGPHFLKAAQDGQTVTFFCEPEDFRSGNAILTWTQIMMPSGRP